MTDINNTNEETLDMLDETLDDLADLPETKPFPAGAHVVNLKVRKNPKKPSQYVVELIHQEVVELTNPDDPHPKAGDKSTVFISTKKKDGTSNEIGQGQIKMILKPIATMLGTNVISEILDQAKDGVQAVVVVSVRKDKDGQYDDQQDIKKVDVV